MTTQTLTSNIQPDTSRLLARVLTLDALTCLGSGAVLALLTEPIAKFLGIYDASLMNLVSGTGFVALIGISLLVFGAWVGWNATRPDVDLNQAWAIAMANFAWVVLSALLLVTNALPLSTAGGWFVLIQADAVLVIAIAEVVGIRRILNRR